MNRNSFQNALGRLATRPFDRSAVVALTPSDGNARKPNEARKNEPHFHDFWILNAPLAGAVGFRTPERTYRVKPLGLLLIAPGARHFTTQPRDFSRGALLLHCSLARDAFGIQISDGRTKLNYFFSEEQTFLMGDILARSPVAACEFIVRAIADDAHRAEDHVCAAWLRFFFAAMEYVFSRPRKPAEPKSSVVSRAMAGINILYQDPDLSVRDIARHVQTPISVLAARFKKTTGLSLRQALISVRLERAQQLLRTGQVLVKEAAHNTGWKNQFYFSNSFKKRFGYSPARGRVRGNGNPVKPQGRQ